MKHAPLVEFLLDIGKVVVSIHAFKPVSTFAAFGVFFVQPHPVYNGRVFFTDTSHQPLVFKGWYNVWVVFGTWTSFYRLHVVGVLLRPIVYIRNLNSESTLTSIPFSCSMRTLFSSPVACSIASGSFLTVHIYIRSLFRSIAPSDLHFPGGKLVSSTHLGNHPMVLMAVRLTASWLSIKCGLKRAMSRRTDKGLLLLGSPSMEG